MADIVSIGEIMIDFINDGERDGADAYLQTAGGAPASVACTAAKLGVSAGFIGKVGRDMFGFYLKKVLIDNNVDTSGLVLDPNYSTPLVFIKSNKDDSGRDFVFYRSSQICADLNLRYGEVNREMIDGCKIFHFGSFSLSAEPSRTATVNAVEYAKLQGKLISYDPYWKPILWENKEDALRAVRSAVQYADIIKVSEQELQIITDCGTLIPAVAKLLQSGVKIICITQGAKGCIIATSKGINRYPSYKSRAVDTLGSGDCFTGAFLSRLCLSGKAPEELDGNDINEMAMFSGACGTLSSAKRGTVPSIPSLKEIEDFMKTAETDESGKNV